MGMRKYERAVIKARCIKRDGNAKNFSEEWKKYHDAEVKARIEKQSNDGNVTAIRTKNTKTKNKHRHYDNGKVMLRHMRAMKQMFANLKKQTEKKKSEKQNNASE